MLPLPPLFGVAGNLVLTFPEVDKCLAIIAKSFDIVSIFLSSVSNALNISLMMGVSYSISLITIPVAPLEISFFSFCICS